MGYRYNMNSYTFELPNPILGPVTTWIHIFLDWATPSWGPVTTWIYIYFDHQPQLGVPLQRECIFIWTTDPIMGSCYNMNSYNFGIGRPKLGFPLQCECIFIWTTDPIMGSRYNINSYIFYCTTPFWGPGSTWIYIHMDHRPQHGVPLQHEITYFLVGLPHHRVPLQHEFI